MKTYFLLSGEHRSLPKAELYAILEAEKIPYKHVKSYDQVEIVSVAGGKDVLNKIVSRASMVREAGMLLGFTVAESLEDILAYVRNSLSWDFLKGKTFAVRAKRIKEYFVDRFRSFHVERAVGAEILKQNPNAKVSLENPHYIVRVILTENVAIIGLKIAELDTTQFMKRRPRSRPFFHPGVLSPKLSRLFVNLSRPRMGDLFLDPFCGVGGFVIEACLLGLKCVCSELRWDLVRGAKINLNYYGFPYEGVVQADATKMPWLKADAIATDPPYGRSTTTLGRPVKNIVRSFLEEAYGVLKKNKYVVYAIPHTLNPYETLPHSGFSIVEIHSMRVHKSLTRIIVVALRR